MMVAVVIEPGRLRYTGTSFYQPVEGAWPGSSRVNKKLIPMWGNSRGDRLSHIGPKRPSGG
jgi:hypothetical protein